MVIRVLSGKPVPKDGARGILLHRVILSHTLFNVYIIRRFGLWCHQYDETQFYFSFLPNFEKAVDMLTWWLGSVMGWMRINKLKVNSDKTQVLWVSKKTD